MDTAIIYLSHHACKQRLVVKETGETYDFHSEAVEIKNQLANMRRNLKRDEGFTFGHVHLVDDFTWHQGLDQCAVYKAEIKYL